MANWIFRVLWPLIKTDDNPFVLEFLNLISSDVKIAELIISRNKLIDLKLFVILVSLISHLIFLRRINYLFFINATTIISLLSFINGHHFATWEDVAILLEIVH